jgi:hypothetical protein
LFRNPEEGQGSQRAVVPVMMMMMMMYFTNRMMLLFLWGWNGTKFTMTEAIYVHMRSAWMIDVDDCERLVKRMNVKGN